MNRKRDTGNAESLVVGGEACKYYSSLPLCDLLQKHNPSRLLISASRSLLDVPGPRNSKTKRYGQRGFKDVAPSLWNVLPESIKEKDSIQSLRPSLRTHFFT